MQDCLQLELSGDTQMHMGKGSDPFRQEVCEVWLLGVNNRSDVKFVMVRI